MLQREMAQVLGYHQATISRWLSGRHAPSLKGMQRIHASYGVPIPVLISAKEAGMIPTIIHHLLEGESE